ERPLEELYCNGKRDGKPCDWDLSSEPVKESGRLSLGPEPVAPPPPTAVLVCSNGHPVTAGDLLCSECGADIGPQPAPPPHADNQIGDWVLDRPLPSTSE